MKTFAEIYARAVERKGEEALEVGMAQPLTAQELVETADDRYLSMMARRIFAAGFVWRVVDAKWPGFEEAFFGFDPEALAELDASGVDALAADTRIIRNRQKIVAVLGNAAFVRAIRAEHGSFGRFVAAWPGADIVGLWEVMGKRGARLGGNTAGMFLRFVGKDTFILSGDVNKALVAHGGFDREPSGKKALRAVQEAFNTWAGESGRPLCQISRVLACSVD